MDEQFTEFLNKLSKNLFYKESNDLKELLNDGKLVIYLKIKKI